MPDPPEVLLEAQRMSQETANPLTDWQCYSTLHGGIGMALVVEDEASSEKVIREAARRGISAQVVGYTVASDAREVTIWSKFSPWCQSGTTLSSLHPF